MGLIDHMENKQNKTADCARIGDISFNAPFFLAPLAGITDSPFRRLCREMGAGLVYSEMVSGKGLFYNDKATERLLYIHPSEKPAAYQVFGSEPDILRFTAEKLADRENCLLDINMGCPVPKVVKNGEGSALMKDPVLAAELVKAAVSAAGKPVTVKMRIGWDEKSINAVDFAKRMEDAGAAAIAVHGRTREQFYSGNADWDVIRAVKQAVSVPVIGNGDVFCGEDALRLMEETGCDFVMIARGALGNPWIFREANALWESGRRLERPSTAEKKEIMIRHFESLLELKGEYAAVREMRKHVGWYMKGVHGSAQLRREINSLTEAEAIFRKFDEICV
ncbi:tRNA dihydrouridine synthase DusB [Bacilliculturomica massiliensis]|uniref:tRNA dihydrouridine synthase DusB n=1 Tax=Bacilliculturomica massiliensis TaxID=1917867 RepID=UPI001FE4C3F7|nr:tRNA dihydrouridine synthase DusB [Bacilliculturomica massiliensis]